MFSFFMAELLLMAAFQFPKVFSQLIEVITWSYFYLKNDDIKRGTSEGRMKREGGKERWMEREIFCLLVHPQMFAVTRAGPIHSPDPGFSSESPVWV